MNRKMWITAGITVASLLVVATGMAAVKTHRPNTGEGTKPAFEPFEAVEVVATREIAWQETADLVGTVVALRSVTVRTALRGVVTHVGFQSGEVIEEGQVLLRQDDTTDRADLAALGAAVRVAEANVVQVDAQIKLAETELGRLSGLPSRAIADVDLDRARTKLDSARADRGRWLAEVDQAKAHVAQVEARLAKLTIKSPFRARAGMRTVHEGQYLAEGVDVVALQELTDEIYLDFAIPQQYAPRVRAGTMVMATCDLLGPDPIGIKVAAVDATVNNDTRNLRVRSIVNNPGGVLVPGMFVQVRVPIEEARSFVVAPRTAERRAAYGSSVFVIEQEKDGDALRAHQRFVTLGQTVGENVIVLKGLKVGERIAAAGAFKLRDGVKVMAGGPGRAVGAPAAASGDKQAAGK